MINLMLNIDLAQNKLEDIYEAITDFESTSEMVSYLCPEVNYNEDVIYYQISIPQVENGFEKLLIEPLTFNEAEIHIEFNQILIKNNETLATYQRKMS